MQRTAKINRRGTLLLFTPMASSFRYLAAALLLLTLTWTAHAQSRIRNGLIFGGVGAQIDGDKMSGYHKAGITGGLSSTIQAGDRWNVRLEVVYMQKGSRSRSQDSIPYPNPTAVASLPPSQQQAYLAQYYQQQPGQWLRYRLNYVQLPVLIEYRANPKITLYGGASVDYLLRATADYGYGYGPPLGVNFRRSDIMGHAGVDLSLGDRWSVTMRLMYSLRDISTNQTGTDRYLFWAGRLGGYRNNLLSTTLRFYLSDTPKFKGAPLFRRATTDGSTPADAPAGTDEGEPTTP
jgi:Outer membrane protein beta-barrel domain